MPSSCLLGQLVLDADGPGGTYSLITSKLAPGYNPIEVPDCGHAVYGDHIDEIFDSDLGSHVFRFYLHRDEDDDRCINFDRQRCEIKTYNQSPDSLLGVEGEQFIYKWKFKLDAGFQSSPKFTHIHQLKAVGGPEASMPLITLTTRFGTPDKLQLRYAETTSQITLQQTDLTPFKGIWCEATENVLYGENGMYSIQITRVSDGAILFSYSDSNIRMWKTNADFVRPKWGIYRSLIEPSYLRDEQVRFTNFWIEEIAFPVPIELNVFEAQRIGNNVHLNWQTTFELTNVGFEIQKSQNQDEWLRIGFLDGVGSSKNKTEYTFIDRQINAQTNYYRLKQIDLNGNFWFSNVVVVKQLSNTPIRLFPNPSNGFLDISGLNGNDIIEILDADGRLILRTKYGLFKKDISNFENGMYYFKITKRGDLFSKGLLKIE